jgi:hypothetical protein
MRQEKFRWIVAFLILAAVSVAGWPFRNYVTGFPFSSLLILAFAITVLVLVRQFFRKTPRQSPLIMVTGGVEKWSKIGAIAGGFLIAVAFIWAILGSKTMPNTWAGALSVLVPGIVILVLGLALIAARVVVWLSSFRS